MSTWGVPTFCHLKGIALCCRSWNFMVWQWAALHHDWMMLVQKDNGSTTYPVICFGKLDELPLGCIVLDHWWRPWFWLYWFKTGASDCIRVMWEVCPILFFGCNIDQTFHRAWATFSNQKGRACMCLWLQTCLVLPWGAYHYGQRPGAWQIWETSYQVPCLNHIRCMWAKYMPI